MLEANLVFVLLIMALVLLLVIISFSMTKKRKRKDRQDIGFQWLATLRLLLAYIQKHRGMSIGFINGGTDLAIQINELHSKVESVTQHIIAINPSINDNQRWVSLIDHWQRIKANYPTFESENNLVQHNQLIKNVLYLIDDIAQDCELLLLKDQQQKPLYIYWRELLTAAEHIGQARAIGIGVSTVASCSSVSRIRLKHSCQKIEDNTKALWKEIESNPQQEACVLKLIDCINNHLTGDKVTIGPKEYFAIATDAIESLFRQFDYMIKEEVSKR
jgi:hypothetical protein